MASAAPAVRTAACACGALEARCAGDPALVSLCHCLACQRRTGGPFGVAAFFPREAVEVSGPSVAFARQAESGYEVVFRFCPVCGSTVWWEPARRPQAIAVAVGAFADPAFPPPTQSVFEASRRPWVEPCLEGLIRR